MEIINRVLEFIEGVGSASGFDLYLKAALALLSIGGGIWWFFYKRKAREAQADRDRQDDRSDNIGDNTRDETQNHQDGSSVRDRLRRDE